MTVYLYSALYGQYEFAKPLPADLGCPAILYTDEPDIHAPGWEVRVVTDHLSDEQIAQAQRADPSATAAMLRHKYWKCHPDQAVPEARISMWVDASLLITADRYAQRCVETLGDDDWCAVRHPYRDCIYDEATFSATLARYDADALNRQATNYMALGHPRHWGLFATGANVRRHTPTATRLSHYWWKECITGSHQDQVSLPVLFQVAQTWPGLFQPSLEAPLAWNADMPWGAWWGVYEHGRPAGVMP